MPMQSEQALVAALAAQQPFEGEVAGGAVYLHIREYVPYVATAVHAGSRLRTSLHGNMALSEQARFEEEDPHTGELIDAMPIVLIARDSRYEYDLNRAPQQAIYTQAWGKEVWQLQPDGTERDLSLSKHAAYYQVLKLVLDTLEKKFGACLVFDIHSYNWQVRQYDFAPDFNLGTAQLDALRWRPVFNTLRQQLCRKKFQGAPLSFAENSVFQGDGYQATFVTKTYKNTLILPLEVRKFFMDELTGELYPLVFEKLKRNLHIALTQTARFFIKRYCSKAMVQFNHVQQHIDPAIKAVDLALYKLARNLDTLHYVNPTNIAQEKRRFFNKSHYRPQFKYRPLRMDPYEFKEQLYRLPVADIGDPLIKDIYRKLIDNFATKIDVITQVGKEQFLYNSLRYYGEPSVDDIANARFIIHATEPQPAAPKTINAEQALGRFEQAIAQMQLPCKVSLSTKLVAKAMVDNGKKTLLVNSTAMFSELDVRALIEHEIGVHLLTTLNAEQQPLHLLRLGLPGNTYTQEGLAIFREFQSGNINLMRLKTLALRVLAVDKMVKGEQFYQVYEFLRDTSYLGSAEAFGLTTRVFRGGGFTKDHLYLKGFRDVVKLSQQRSLDNLYLGKTGLAQLDAIDMLVERQLLDKPAYLPDYSRDPAQPDAILSYLISCIK
uniref:Flavohemoglobin expression-modulating QEGLA motif protein n=2 Tax=Pseudoalteromonas rubra TaxID=43658 RepID=A0A0F4R060_9GAMM|nr:hypothetical protein TW77_00200 [Pseudoalteromonas rubra]